MLPEKKSGPLGIKEGSKRGDLTYTFDFFNVELGLKGLELE